jgi:hypothetical protein
MPGEGLQNRKNLEKNEGFPVFKQGMPLIREDFFILRR